ncbi:DNA cytosine methyltransferase [Pseudomonas alliivorans]|uniref:DNA cytosine methyltransferase n=1 Tax=Pseudomonas alliivorans TaxID=2810613 RepID=UPI0020913EAA|nr:DNA cytosine methyltransferase [Pseudomonas alliivorans]MCO5365380.1 DNA cytosine methyltransferase [Pseudomonas alliivorans]MEE4679142.1 DNA cytosine methyltransferase [Pseudomonas alliivorans]MEE4719393.1 DNA cytosine methyltransferase [Pseudomonas alliivorans]MEE4724414.1 DNA cytosine methyltransferase [Pseudomonas alliivorans]MEE4760471.1 DNA cytosine methyltransferase [Pseudomonas alliivorans]
MIQYQNTLFSQKATTEPAFPVEDAVQIVDLFAGPGGLGEGFSSSGNGKHFDIIVSAEMDPIARRTLRLRAFYRLLKREYPQGLQDYYLYCNGEAAAPNNPKTEEFWARAEQEARQITLGSEEGDRELDNLINARLNKDGRPWVLIGGPPCQAYSIVGRSRNQSKQGYIPENDHRHFLYKDYLRIIKDYRPTVFVMENVKGILSSKVGGKGIFAQILQDLVDPTKALDNVEGGQKYKICSMVSEESFSPSDCIDNVNPKAFIIQAEKYGIPQARHRVILLGIALDEQGNIPFHELLKTAEPVSVKQAIGSLPRLRSKLSRRSDTQEAWYQAVAGEVDDLLQHAELENGSLIAPLRATRKALFDAPKSSGGERVQKEEGQGNTGIPSLDAWYQDTNIKYWMNHNARSHMRSDLRRYVFASTFAEHNKYSPKGHQQFSLPGLAPAHKNWESGKFSDRFRVQLAGLPATTITSHISKDGHYFIHYDPTQCRSLTVREAARLQTFPDNYFFEGTRTQQYHQVGNAVPPLLAKKIAEIVYDVVCRRAAERQDLRDRRSAQFESLPL